MASSEEDGSVEEKENNNKKRSKSALVTAWLTFYNIAMTAGWLVLAIAMLRFYLERRTHIGLYRSISRTLKFFQTVALVEVIHCAVGMVRTSVIVTGVQVCSRIFMVWFVTNSIKQQYFCSASMPAQRSLSTNWSLLPTIYSRYNLFIVLYPLGVAGELLTIYTALPFVRKSGMFSMRLPNKYNVSFDYYIFLIIIMLSYIPLFPQLYFHMLRQRRKVLHGEVIVEKDE